MYGVPVCLPFCILLQHVLITLWASLLHLACRRFAIGIKISTPTYTVQRTEWQPRLLVLVNLNQFTSSLSHFDISSHRYF